MARSRENYTRSSSYSVFSFFRKKKKKIIFGSLSPNVIVYHVLPFHEVYVFLYNNKSSPYELFGYFVRDRSRAIWHVFRSIYVSFYVYKIREPVYFKTDNITSLHTGFYNRWQPQSASLFSMFLRLFRRGRFANLEKLSFFGGEIDRNQFSKWKPLKGVKTLEIMECAFLENAAQQNKMLLKDVFPNVVKLVLSSCSYLLKEFENNSSIQVLEIHSWEDDYNTDAHYDLVMLNNLKNLKFSNLRMTGIDLKRQNFVKLETLMLEGMYGFTNYIFQNGGYLLNLKELVLVDCEQLSGKHYRVFTNNLKRISLRNLYLFEDEFFTRNFPVLEELDVTSCYKIRGRGWKPMPSLKKLKFRHQGVVDELFQLEFESLEKIEMENYGTYGKNMYKDFRGRGWVHMKGFKKLKSFRMEYVSLVYMDRQAYEVFCAACEQRGIELIIGNKWNYYQEQVISIAGSVGCLAFVLYVVYCYVKDVFFK